MTFRKCIAILLCVTMLLPLGLTAFAAEGDADGETDAEPPYTVTVANSLESAFAEGENSLLLFVTGIGQSFSYLFDESYLAPDAFEHGTLQDYENYAPLIANGKYKARWNLFNDFSEQFDQAETKQTVAKLAFQLILTLFARRNMMKDDDIRAVVKELFAFNLVDENGEHNPRVITPRYTCPVSEYPEGVEEDGSPWNEAKHRFYTSIPCGDVAREKLGANYEDYLYCFNFNPFSYITKNVEDLHTFIETVLRTNKVGATKVVLIPMSMGASVVSAYLAAYPNVEENHVRRVVSVVGAWNGSDIILDLVRESYADNSADLFYNGIIADLVGAPWGYLVNFALRLFAKQSLRDFIDQALAIFVDELFLHTPSLFALVPDYGYAEVRPKVTSPAILRETDFYHEAQASLKDRLAALEAQGVTFSFISGYGLPYGAITGDYKVFGFLHSAERTNSDEIINIDSTAPGTKYVAYNQKFTDPNGRVLSPDGSIDIAGTYYKDSSWYFYEQKHELEYNNTALSLAVNLALGKIKTVADCDDPNEDAAYYPQFNGARYIRDLTRDYIPAYEAYIAAGNEPSPALKAQYEKCVAMMNSTVNDPSADGIMMDSFRDMLIAAGALPAPAKTSGIERLLGKSLEKGNGLIERIFGSKGFLDFTK